MRTAAEELAGRTSPQRMGLFFLRRNGKMHQGYLSFIGRVLGSVRVVPYRHPCLRVLNPPSVADLPWVVKYEARYRRCILMFRCKKNSSICCWAKCVLSTPLRTSSPYAVPRFPIGMKTPLGWRFIPESTTKRGGDVVNYMKCKGAWDERRCVG